MTILNAASAKNQIRGYIEGKLVPSARFGLPAMNFGQAAPGFQLVPYELVMPLEAFVALIQPRFEQFASEVRGDESDEDDPQLREFIALGYPGVDKLSRENPSLLGSLIQRWLRLELLDLCSDHSSGPGYAFNSLDAITVLPLPNEVRLAGRAFTVR